jgi:hypothetical protein
MDPGAWTALHAGGSECAHAAVYASVSLERSRNGRTSQGSSGLALGLPGLLRFLPISRAISLCGKRGRSRELLPLHGVREK